VCLRDALPDNAWGQGTVDGNEAAVAALEAYAFAADWTDKDRRGVRTDAVLVIKGGTIVYERYDNGYGPSGVHLGWSMTKTATALLAGMAIEAGQITLDTSVCEHLEGLPEDRCAVTLGDLLDFGSNFSWQETYEGQSPTNSSVLAMLYGEGKDAMGPFVAGHPLRGTPGEAYQYSSGDTNVVSAMLHAVLAPVHGDRWPEVLLLDRLGITTATWERDGSGVPIGSSYLWATARDFGRLGAVLRDGGCWRGTAVVDNSWVRFLSSVNDPIKKTAYDRWTDNVQGRQLWLNQALPTHGLAERPWPDVPQDAVALLGHWGQSVTAIPSADLVVVRLADDRDHSFDRNRFLSLALAVAVAGPVPDPEAGSARGPVGETAPASGRVYETALLKIATRFAAKEACSCTFVTQRDEGWCRAWLRVSPDVARWRVKGENTVQAKALGLAKSTARFLGPGRGCELVQ
jgi:CubicO group peptidase (beta-lactamase class C family)